MSSKLNCTPPLALGSLVGAPARGAGSAGCEREPGAVPMVAAVAVAVAVVVVALTTIGHGHPGGPQTSLDTPGVQRSQELGHIRAAEKKASRAPACLNRGPVTPAVSHGAPSRALLSILGVLGRPATTADNRRDRFRAPGTREGSSSTTSASRAPTENGGTCGATTSEIGQRGMIGSYGALS